MRPHGRLALQPGSTPALGESESERAGVGVCGRRRAWWKHSLGRGWWSGWFALHNLRAPVVNDKHTARHRAGRGFEVQARMFDIEDLQ